MTFQQGLSSLVAALGHGACHRLLPQHGLYTAIIAGIVTPLRRLPLAGQRPRPPSSSFWRLSSGGLRGIIWCQIFSRDHHSGMGLMRIGK
jgi:hypothetical protein